MQEPVTHSSNCHFNILAPVYDRRSFFTNPSSRTSRRINAIAADPFLRSVWLVAAKMAPTIKNNFHTILSACDCLPEIESILNSDPRLNDCFVEGGGYPSYFVSERIVDDLRSSISRLTEMPIAKIDAKRLKNTPASRYFVIETHAGIEIDFEGSGIQTDAEGRISRAFSRKRVGRI